MDTKPHFNYAEFPHLSREGILSEGNSKFRTVSLFLETCPKGKEDEVLWCLSETEQWCEASDRWVPSAWMCYLYADNEYDAMRKIVGNIRQWEILKELKWFKEKFAMWEAEQDMMIKSNIKSALAGIVTAGAQGSTGAAKMLLDYFGTTVKKGKGRPVKEKEDNTTPEDKDVNDDLARITPLTRKG